MANLDKVINKNLIDLDLKGNSQRQIVENLTDLLVNENLLLSREEYIENVFNREGTMSTFCGSEIAIPHAISSSVKSAAVCFGRSEGLYWNNEEEFVRFIFLLALPKEFHSDEHIEIISAIAKCSLNPKIRKMWINATSAEQILDSLKQSVQ